MKIAESDGCFLGGKFRNGESHFSLINWLTQKTNIKESSSRFGIGTEAGRDEKTTNSIKNWLTFLSHF